MAQMTAPEPPLDLYVDRKPSLRDLVDWLSEPKPRTRLLSIVGPPGCGKTVTLRQLAGQLRERNRPVYVLPDPLPIAGLEATPTTEQPAGSEDWLDRWCRAQLQLMMDAGYLKSVDDVPGEPAGQFQAAIGLLARWTAPVLLVDGLDELPDDERWQVEERIVVPFLFPRNVQNPETRVIIAHRDQYGLGESILRWEEAVCELKPLNEPEKQQEQVRRRLADILATNPDSQPAVAAARESARKLSQDDIAAVVEKLRASLTPNPFINVALLERQLMKPNMFLSSSDYRDCLAVYLGHAGLVPEEYLQILLERVTVLKQRPFSVQDYDSIGAREELELLLEKGIAAQAKHVPGFQFDPAVVKLVRMIAGEEPVPGKDNL